MKPTLKEEHDVHETPMTEAKIELDDEDTYELLCESWHLIGVIIERGKLPKQLHTDLVRLHERIEPTITWHLMQ